MYAPVMVMKNGQRVIKPMRYQCRPAGKPKLYDTKFPGTYNARRDNLDGFWRDLFGYSHRVMVANASLENVSRARMEGRELQDGEKDQNVVLGVSAEHRRRHAGRLSVVPAARRRASRTCCHLPQSPTNATRGGGGRPRPVHHAGKARQHRCVAVSRRTSSGVSTTGKVRGTRTGCILTISWGRSRVTVKKNFGPVIARFSETGDVP
jgi:hypothetical protein